VSSKIISCQISGDLLTPVSALLKISQKYSDYHFLLESVEKGRNRGRYSVIGLLPDLIWECKNGQAFINNSLEEEDPISSLRELINNSQIDKNSAKEKLPFTSGIFGYMGYDMVRLMEELPDCNLEDEIGIPDSIFIRPQILILFDDLFDLVKIYAPIYEENPSEEKKALAENLVDQVKQILLHPAEGDKELTPFSTNFVGNFSKEEYCQKVEDAKKYIKNGDIFQTLPSIRFSSDFPNENSFHFYRSLRRVNPSPFLFYLKFDNFVLTGSSPEIMVSLKDKKMTVRPLAGTRKRSDDEAKNQKMAKELLADEKELAEHLMLIDLGRHDTSRVCVPGSVKLTEKMVIENYSHVMHISSNIEGRLDDCNFDALDALVSAFPAGTVSGAPKIRAMEIIEELENVKRSFYAGCVGYFDGSGKMESCITLRSALIKNNKIYLQAGAGVVFDSIPENEYQECLNKAQALMQAAQLMVV